MIPMVPSTRRIVLPLACLLVLGSLISAVIIILQITDTNWHDLNTQFDEDMGWATIPNRSIIDWGTKHFSSNSLGFRSPELDNSRRHVLVLGDSVAWGYGLGDNETISYNLQAFFDRNMSGYQVQNLAVSGYGIDQYYMDLERNINKTNPQIVIVIICTNNDILDTEQDAMYGKSKPLFILENGTLRNIKGKISRFSCTNIFYNNLFFEYIPQISRLGAICPIRKFEDEGFHVKAGLLDRIVELSRDHDAETYFVVSPNLQDYHENGSRHDFADAETFFQSQDYTYLDVYNITRASGIDTDSLYLPDDDTHYSVSGSRYVAGLIFSWLNGTV